MAAYTTIDDPSAHFNTIIYTHAVTPDDRAFTFDGNSNLQPDLSWIKRRDTTTGHILQDSSRGVTKYFGPHTDAAEGTYSGYLKSFNTNGLTIGGGDSATNQGSGGTGVIWAWRAGGGTTATNTTGSVDSVVQVNQDAGFSIVTFTSASSGAFSVGHGLGVLPGVIIVKNREAASQWRVWHKELSNLVTTVVSLNRTDAEENYTAFWGAGVTSSVFGSKTGMSVDASDSYLAYCFAEKQGYSKFGKYKGNGSTNGTFVYTGFKPAMVITKKSSTSGNWTIYDNKRDPSNPADTVLLPNAETADQTVINFDFVSNGFKCRNSGSENENGTTYIYMAFAENPFVTSTGIPATAR